MLSDDIFYSRFCDLIVGAEKDAASEDMKVLNDEEGCIKGRKQVSEYQTGRKSIAIVFLFFYVKNCIPFVKFFLVASVKNLECM